MELNKKNYSRILNNFIAGITLVLVTIILALGFISPVTKAVAVTEAEIQDIYFVSAKTKVRSAKGINRVQLTGMDSNQKDYSFLKYQYDYNTHTNNLYYAKSLDAIKDSTYGDISLSIGDTSPV